jgi:hypothetical protein
MEALIILGLVLAAMGKFKTGLDAGSVSQTAQESGGGESVMTGTLFYPTEDEIAEQTEDAMSSTYPDGVITSDRHPARQEEKVQSTDTGWFWKVPPGLGGML